MVRDPVARTRALALMVVDSDAPVGMFTDWLARNIDPAAAGAARLDSADQPGSGREHAGE
jgi:phosphatidylethanolamine-binding protein (PEBP) family uncharacterized protein